MKYENTELRQMLAAEYALGTLRGRARRRLEKLAGREPAIRAEITRWEARLAEFDRTLAPVTPPAAVWLGLQHRVQVAAPKIAPLRPIDRRPVEAPPKPASLWRIGAGLATAAAVVLAVMIGQRLPLPGTQPVASNAAPAGAQTPAAAGTESQPALPTYVALLKLPEATMQWTLSLAPARGRISVAASGEYAKLGQHSLELWVITPGGPVSLGVLPVRGTAVLTLPGDLAAGETITLAVSLEPVGGSPSGKPTGPVLTSGAAVKAV